MCTGGPNSRNGVDLGVVVAVAVGVAVGVDVGVGDGPQYLPPVLKDAAAGAATQTIISLPVETAVGTYRAVGALVVLVAVQLSVPGLYLLLVSKY